MKMITAIVAVLAIGLFSCQNMKDYFNRPDIQTQITQIEQAAYDAGYAFITDYIKSHLGAVKYHHLMRTKRLDTAERFEKQRLTEELVAKYPKLDRANVEAAVSRGFEKGATSAGER